MKQKIIMILCIVMALSAAVLLSGCGNALGVVDEYIELKANPGTVALNKTVETTITCRIFDAGSNKGYKVEFSTTDGGYFTEADIMLFGQTYATTQFYPAELTGGDTQKIVTIRARVSNLETFKEYTGQVNVQVRQVLN